MEPIPLYLTAARTARIWKLPIGQAHAIVREAIHSIPMRHQAWISTACLGGLLLLLGLADAPCAVTRGSAGWLAIRGGGIVLMSVGLLAPRLLVRRTIRARAEAAATLDARGETTRERAVALSSGS